MLRTHALPILRKDVHLPWADDSLSVLTMAPVEIFATKTVALFSRIAPRDLYDLYNMVRYKVVEDDQEDLYKKSTVFYSAISTERPPEKFEIDSIGNVTKMQIKRDLDPVLRRGEPFDLNAASDAVKEYLSKILMANDDEKLFWKNFSDGKYEPRLVFGDDIGDLELHPMALWKCRNI